LRHYNIPIFVPELGCPHRCVFCNQQNISGVCNIPKPAEVAEIINQHLGTFKQDNRRVEVAFFGGSFTGLPVDLQVDYLSTVAPFMEQGQVQSIRLSTRPDYITAEILDILYENGVGTIELGAQSMDGEVLQLSGRGHTAKQVETASKQILQKGFDLGLQMMVGLPADTFHKSMHTASRFVELGASQVRIYPTLVIRDTPLALLFQKEKYTPLEMQAAVDICKELVLLFEKNGIKVLRVGLHPSEGLASGADLLAGPFHPAFKELVETAIWADILKENTNSLDLGSNLEIRVSPRQLNAAIGHGAENKKRLLEFFKSVSFIADKQLEGRQVYVSNC
jgi:histone acetyltransferase (RNA polymerase elongator complex component)